MTHPFTAKEAVDPSLQDPVPTAEQQHGGTFWTRRSKAELQHNSANGFYAKPNFDHWLYLERKRTERSKRSFLLVLLNVESLLTPGADRCLVKNLEQALSSCIRETDIRGWYEQDKTVGIIFTEIGGIEEVGREKIFLKIQEKLCQALGPEVVQKIKVSYLAFPESCRRNGDYQEWFNLSLYPELTRRNHSKAAYLFAKRTMDLVGSLMGLIILSPLFLLIALGIKLTSGGPVFFRQERIGQKGQKFTFFKFRSMYSNCDESPHKEYIASFISEGQAEACREEGEPVIYKLRNDCRITPIGKFLRQTSLDELPQFINVLKGEMSLVGPRPPIEYEVELYDIWHRKRLLEVKPGITGLWQVEGRSKRAFNDMVRLDLKYINEWSLWLDLKIIFKTPWVMITGTGGY